MHPVAVRIFGVPTACATGVSDAWREVADWARKHEWEIFVHQSNEGWASQLPQFQNLAAPTRRHGGDWAREWWYWYDSGGTKGEEPPQQIKDNYDLYDRMNKEADEDKLAELTREWYRNQAEQVWTVPHLTFPPEFFVFKPNLGNVNPKTGTVFAPGAFMKGEEY